MYDGHRRLIRHLFVDSPVDVSIERSNSLMNPQTDVDDSDIIANGLQHTSLLTRGSVVNNRTLQMYRRTLQPPMGFVLHAQ
jgi:hypothetical protein